MSAILGAVHKNGPYRAVRLCSSFRRWPIPTEDDFFNNPFMGVVNFLFL